MHKPDRIRERLDSLIAVWNRLDRTLSEIQSSRPDFPAELETGRNAVAHEVSTLCEAAGMPPIQNDPTGISGSPTEHRDSTAVPAIFAWHRKPEPDAANRKRSDESTSTLSSRPAPLPLAFWTTDLDLRFTSFSVAPLYGSGCPAVRAGGETVFSFFRADNRDSVDEKSPGYPAVTAHRRGLAGEGSQFEWHQDDCCLWVNVQPLRRADGPVVGTAATAIDLTALERTREHVLQHERLAAIGQVVTGLAHESRNALQRSQACLERLALRVHDRTDVTDLIVGIQEAQDHLHNLYESVQSYAAPLKLNVRHCNLGEILREAWNNLARARQNRDVKLVEESRGEDMEIEADPVALQQVLRNILENAMAACCATGAHTGTLERVLVAGPSGEWLLAVTDNGHGLEKETQQRIFDPFFTTKTRGTGLGMAVAKRIVEAHGGAISAGGIPGKGAEIIITLARNLA